MFKVNTNKIMTNIAKYFLNFKLSIFEKIYIFLLLSFILISYFISIPTDSTPLGIGSEILGIGDREFYINETNKGYGYKDYSGNFLYPYALKFITSLSNLFGQDQYSKLWNSIAIFITSFFSIVSLRLLKKSSIFLFNENVSEIACFLFIINPYSYFYALSGGITNYLFLGSTSILFLFCRAYRNGYKISESKYILETLILIFICTYLSLLRPTGALYSYVVLLYLLYGNLKNFFYNKQSGVINFLNFLLITLGIIFVSYNFFSVVSYLKTNIKLFMSEDGYFFGYSRELLRQRLSLDGVNIFENLKLSFYTILWKLTEFVSGLSDIRDTHSAPTIKNIFPFLIRTFTGIFILFPLNIFSFFGLIFNRRFILKSDIWIVILSSLLAISPSLLGVAMSRYLIMFYSIFIIFSAKMISDLNFR